MKESFLKAQDHEIVGIMCASQLISSGYNVLFFFPDKCLPKYGKNIFLT